MFAGTWRKNKGIEDLVPAFIGLAEHHRDLTLHVIGAGVPPDAIRAQFPEAIRGRIHCDTPQDDFAMAAAFAAADVFLLPSLFEGTPLTLMQAMMSGLPIVTTGDVRDEGRHRRSAERLCWCRFDRHGRS